MTTRLALPTLLIFAAAACHQDDHSHDGNADHQHSEGEAAHAEAPAAAAEAPATQAFYGDTEEPEIIEAPADHGHAHGDEDDGHAHDNEEHGHPHDEDATGDHDEDHGHEHDESEHDH